VKVTGPDPVAAAARKGGERTRGELGEEWRQFIDDGRSKGTGEPDENDTGLNGKTFALLSENSYQNTPERKGFLSQQRRSLMRPARRETGARCPFIGNFFVSTPTTLRMTEDPRDRSYSWKNRIVFVSNVPFHYKAQDLLLIMRQFGRCFRVDLSRNPQDGRSRGFAFVEFEKRQHARIAAEYLDGAEIDGRYLRAELSEFPPNQLVDMYV
jgi:hypothetical protein